MNSDFESILHLLHLMFSIIVSMFWITTSSTFQLTCTPCKSNYPYNSHTFTLCFILFLIFTTISINFFYLLYINFNALYTNQLKMAEGSLKHVFQT